MEKEINIALVIKTEGLEYDDRVRKEILTIEKIYPNIKFKIFAMLPGNKEEEGMTKYGVPYKSLYIPARDKYPSASKTTLKAWQFYKAAKKEIKGYDAVWVANVDAAFVPMFLHHRRILWDLHELPLKFAVNWLMRQLLRYTFSRCKVVIHANPQRADYLANMGVIDDCEKHIALRNYPNFDDVDCDRDDLFKKFLKWKGERKCVYLQGLSEERRAAYESVAAVLKQGDLVAVVVGRMFPDSLERLKKDFGEDIINKRILFVGKIAQLKIPQYVAECQMSLVFYKNVQPNNWFCEANRFYQSVILGLPVVTGNNPSMKELVDKYGFGVSIDNDGNNIDKIVAGMNQVLSNYDMYHQNTITYRNNLLWDNQEDVIKEIVDLLFN